MGRSGRVLDNLVEQFDLSFCQRNVRGCIGSVSIDHGQQKYPPAKDTKHRNQVSQPVGRPQPRLFGFASRLQNLVKRLDFPARRVPVEFLDSVTTGAHWQIRDQLPFDRLPICRFTSFRSMDHRHLQRCIAASFTARRQGRNLTIFNFEKCVRRMALRVSGLYAV